MKNATLMSLGLLVVATTGHAQQALTYSTIVAQYTNKQPIADVPTAIKIVKEHCNNLKAQRRVYLPGALRMLGKGLAITSVLGIIGEIGSAWLTYALLNSPENVIGEVKDLMREEIAKIPSEKLDEKQKQDFKEYLERHPNQKGFGLFDYFKTDYLGMKDLKLQHMTSQWYLEFRYKYSQNAFVQGIVSSGRLAPIALCGSAMIAWLSKILLNQAASCHNQALEDLIAQDEKMLMDLRAQKAMLS